MPNDSIIDYFVPKMNDYKIILKAEIHALAKNGLELVDAFDFRDDELMTVLGKKSTPDD